MNLVEQNKIPYTPFLFTADMQEYIQKGGALLRRRNNRKKQGLVCKRSDARARLEPYDYCYYTGIKFADVEQKYVNPNDPRKRTIDHKVPLAICYIEGWSIEKANHPDNLVYCIRALNNLRSSTLLESFIPIAQWYRKKLLEEGYEALDIQDVGCYNK